jgi:hypothetical protein
LKFVSNDNNILTPTISMEKSPPILMAIVGSAVSTIYLLLFILGVIYIQRLAPILSAQSNIGKNKVVLVIITQLFLFK